MILYKNQLSISSTMSLIIMFVLTLFQPAYSIFPTGISDMITGKYGVTSSISHVIDPYKNVVRGQFSMNLFSSVFQNAEDFGLYLYNLTEGVEMTVLPCMFGNVIVEKRAANEEDDANVVDAVKNVFERSAGGSATQNLRDTMEKYTKMYPDLLEFDMPIFMEMFEQTMPSETASMYTCWPAHGFHVHVNSEGLQNRPYHYGPMCKSHEYYSVKTRACTACENGELPDWKSALFLQSVRTQNNYFNVDDCKGEDALKQQEEKDQFVDNVLCTEIVSTVGVDGLQKASTYTDELLSCIHKQCAASVDNEYRNLVPSIGWNFGSTHPGEYHPYSPMQCAVDSSNTEDRFRGDCGKCSYRWESSRCVEYLNFLSGDSCQTADISDETMIMGIDRISPWITVPIMDLASFQYVLNPSAWEFEGLVFESNVFTYCHTMKHDGRCGRSVQQQNVSDVQIVSEAIYISAGETTFPYYDFYLNDEYCNNTDAKISMQNISNMILSPLDENTEYIFERCDNVSENPFAIHKTGSTDEFGGIVSRDKRKITTGGTGRILKWVNKDNETINGYFVVGGPSGSNWTEFESDILELHTGSEDTAASDDSTNLMSNGWKINTDLFGTETYVGKFDTPDLCFENTDGSVSYSKLTKRCYVKSGQFTEYPRTMMLSKTKETTSQTAQFNGISGFQTGDVFSQLSDHVSRVGNLIDDVFEVQQGSSDTVIYTFTSNTDLGHIMSAHISFEDLDNDAILQSSDIKRSILGLGVNYQLNEIQWSSIHVVELDSRKGPKSLCLAGYFNRAIKEIHGIAIVPFTQSRPLSKPTSEHSAGGVTPTWTKKIDEGFILVSITDESNNVKMWFTSFEGIPINVDRGNPGTQLVNFPHKWTKYAVHKNSIENDYFLMAVITHDNYVYIFDGVVDQGEWFQIEMRKGIVSTSANSRHDKPNEHSNQYVKILDIKWVGHDTYPKLLVLTESEAYLYTTVRSNLPRVPCVPNHKQREIDNTILPGHYYSATSCSLAPIKCPEGQYQDQRGQKSCIDCKAGKYTDDEGQSKCKDCRAGKHQYLTGQTGCDGCLPGFYSDTPGLQGLNNLEHSRGSLTYTCKECPVGYFSMEREAFECKKCIGSEYCTVSGQYFPHTECTTYTKHWLDRTDHLHQFCCSTSSTVDNSYIANMQIDAWRQSSKISCVRKTPIKTVTRPENCEKYIGNIERIIQNPAGQDIMDNFFALSSPTDNDWDEFEKQINQTFELYDLGINATANAALQKIANETKQYEDCLANLIVSNSTHGDYVTREGYPPQYLFNENEEVCYAVTTTVGNPNSLIQYTDEWKTCCPNYADSVDIQNTVTNTIDLQIGDRVDCVHLYGKSDVDMEKVDMDTLQTTETIVKDSMQCFLEVNTATKHFHHTMSEIVDSCPSVKQQIKAYDWSNFDVQTVSYFENEGNCSIEYVGVKEKQLFEDVTITNLDGEQCSDQGYEWKSPQNTWGDLVHVISPEPCGTNWSFISFHSPGYEYKDYTSEGVCPSGFDNLTIKSSTKYKVITGGECDDEGSFKPIPWSECTPSLIYDIFGQKDVGVLAWDPGSFHVPSVCTVSAYVFTETLTPIEMQNLFKNQTCTSDYPCICRQTLPCMREVEEIEDNCSPNLLCRCARNATECHYNDYNVNDTCTCSRPTNTESSRTLKRFGPTPVLSTPNKTWDVNDYTYISGKYNLESNTFAAIVKKSWTIDNGIPNQIAKDSDPWDGFFTGDYHYDIESHETSTILQNMKGGVYYESTEGEDEFRFCLHEWEEYNNETNQYDDKRIYCSTFFPYAVEKKGGGWKCTSVHACPFWEHWPPPIDNATGFVETDPCLCNGKEEYGGYCIPDGTRKMPKRGSNWKTLLNVSEVKYFALSRSDEQFIYDNGNLTTGTLTNTQQKTTLSSDIVMNASVISGNHVACTFRQNEDFSGIVVDTTEISTAPYTLSRYSTTPLAISYDGNVVVASLNTSIHVYSLDGSQWERRNLTASGFQSGNVALSKSGDVLAFSTLHDVRVYSWNSLSQYYENKGQAINIANFSAVKLSDDGDVLSVQSSNSVLVYRWKEANWKQKGNNIQINEYCGMSIATKDKIIVCDCNTQTNGFVHFYEWRRGQWDTFAVYNASSELTYCDVAADISYLVTLENNTLTMRATGLEEDIYNDDLAFWVRDVDEIFTNTTFSTYHKDCAVGIVSKATTEIDWEEIDWWKDTYDRACFCRNTDELCSGYHAHELYFGFNHEAYVNSQPTIRFAAENELLTMTCASDGCIYDKITKSDFVDMKENNDNCEGAENIACGVYSFGTYYNGMIPQVLKGVYDEDGKIVSGIFKCPNEDATKRNDFIVDGITLYTRDGDFDVLPNGIPAQCACGYTICEYNQYCNTFVEDSTRLGFCGHTKSEIKQKTLKRNILDTCKELPDVIENVVLQNFKSENSCNCHGEYCSRDQYCSKEGCVECVCGHGEYEEIRESLGAEAWDGLVGDIPLDGISTCKSIKNCEPGEYIHSAPTKYTDRKCSTCVDGSTFSLDYNSRTCLPCTVCNIENKREAQTCTLKQDRKCVDKVVPKCKFGAFEMSNGTCLLCDDGEYLSKKNETCLPCGENQYTYKDTNDGFNVCADHATCNCNGTKSTHYWRDLPSKTSPGKCVIRNPEACATRILGNCTTDDICEQNYPVGENMMFNAYQYEMSLLDGQTTMSTLRSMVSTIYTIFHRGWVQREPDLDLIIVVSRILDQNALTKEAYMNATFADRNTRIYANLNEQNNKTAKLIEAKVFDMNQIPNSVDLVFFTKHENITIEKGPWDCHIVKNYSYRCI